MYIQECEGLIRQLQVDLQILRDENYYQLEELAFRVMRLQDELVTLRLECTNLYRKGHFTSLELAPPSTLTTTHLKAEPVTKGTYSSSTSWFRKPMSRAELVSISSSEDEGNLRFVYELLSWVEEMQVGVCFKCLCSAFRFTGSSSLSKGARLLYAPCVNSLNY